MHGSLTCVTMSKRVGGSSPDILCLGDDEILERVVSGPMFVALSGSTLLTGT